MPTSSPTPEIDSKTGGGYDRGEKRLSPHHRGGAAGSAEQCGMGTVILGGDDLRMRVDVESVEKSLRIRPDQPDAARFREMIEEAARIARPKVIFRRTEVESIDEQGIVIGGIRLNGPLLHRNLRDTGQVIPFVATCGREVNKWATQFSDLLESYWADEIKNQALLAALGSFHEVLESLEEIHHATMNPGSLPSWPIEQQGSLFRVLGDVEGAIGVSLTESFLMIPNKSVSGIAFPSQVGWQSCLLCGRPNCPNRRAEYCPDRFAE